MVNKVGKFIAYVFVCGRDRKLVIILYISHVDTLTQDMERKIKDFASNFFLDEIIQQLTKSI